MDIGIRLVDGQNALHGKARTSSAKRVEEAQRLRTIALELVNKATQHGLVVAARQLKLSARLFRDSGLNTAGAADYLSLGQIYFTWSKYRQALDFYSLALRLSKPSNIELRCSILSRIAITYFALNQGERALRFSRQAVALSNRAASVHAKAEASEALGESLLYLDPNQSLNQLHNAKGLFTATTDVDGQARAELNSGFAYASIGSMREAFSAQSEALRLWSESGNVYGSAQAHAAIALIWAATGEPEKAISEYRAAKAFFHSIGDQGDEAITLNGLGLVSADLGDYESSLRYYQEARGIFAFIGDQVGEIGGIEGAAKAEWSLHRYRLAKTLYGIRLKHALQAQNPRLEASALSDLADIYVYDHDYTRARRLYRRALQLCHSVHHAIGETNVLIRIGRLYGETGQYNTAIQSLQGAVRLTKETGRIASRAQAHYELAQVYRGLNQFDAAKVEVENATAIIESERTKVSDFESRATYFASVHAYYQLYIDILMQLDQQHPGQRFAQRAFEASEKSKVRSLLDMLASTGNQSECDTLPAKSASNPLTAAPGQAGEDCAAGPIVLSLPQVQSAIQGDDVVLLEYALGSEGSYLWAVSHDHFSSYRLPGTPIISGLVMRFRDALTARQMQPKETAEHYTERVERADKAINSIARQLSQTLLGPASNLLTSKLLIIIPDGPLQYIPFAALPLPALNGDQEGTALSATYEVASLPSASTLQALRDAAQRRSPPTQVAAVFADPVFSKDDPRVVAPNRASAMPSPVPAILGAAMRDAQFGSGKISRLSASRAEAESMERAFSVNEVFLAMDFDASRNTVLTSDLQRFRYIHFATHGILDSKHPEFSGLILSLVNRHGEPEEGYLRMRDIYNLKLSADLVVLSACNSALGKDLQSEGVLGLTRAFLYAGSQRVVSTLWKVNDQATAEFMQKFYSRLHDHESPAEALRGAQSDLAKDPNWHHPYYWAAFVLQGEYR